MSDRLLPCPLCSGELEMFVDDVIRGKFIGWIGGASCELCKVRFEVGVFNGGLSVEAIEKRIVKVLNRRVG